MNNMEKSNEDVIRLRNQITILRQSLSKSDHSSKELIYTFLEKEKEFETEKNSLQKKLNTERRRVK